MLHLTLFRYHMGVYIMINHGTSLLPAVVSDHKFKFLLSLYVFILSLFDSVYSVILIIL